MIKLFRRLLKRRPVVVTHVHDLLELPCDMGRKIYRKCRDCDFSETIPAPIGDQLTMEPVAARVREFQRGILDAVAREVEGRP